MGRGFPRLAMLGAALAALSRPALAHEKGRPVPAITQAPAGPYSVSLWSTTETGTGAVYVVVHPRPGVSFVAPTSVQVALRHAGARDTAVTYTLYATPVKHGARFTTAVWLANTGPYEAQVTLEGTAGRAVLATRVDVGPTGTVTVPWIMLYAAPFVLVAGLWVRARSLRRSRPSLVLATPPSL